jgi:hypothetical protein
MVSIFGRVSRYQLLWSLALVVCLPSGGRGADFSDAGLLFDKFELTLDPGHRTEALGPLFYDEHKESQRTWALPPLLSSTHDPEVELKEFNILYPVLSYDRYGDQYRWQLFQLLSFAGGPTQQEKDRNRITLFPIYFQQRSSDPSQNYTAVVPFYGHLQNRLFRDDIFFVMFPLYSETRKGAVVTDNYLYPFFHLRHGPGLEGWQFWPLAGHEHKEITTRTNAFHEVETVPGHDKVFALWPIYFNQHTGLGTTNPVWEKGLLPAYSKTRSPQRDATTVLWPFFTRVDDREKKYREWDAPWPLVEMAHGEGKTTTRVWPFYSHASTTNRENDFYLWPVYRHVHIHAAPLERQRTRILFFLYSDSADKSTETGQSRCRVDLWPLFTHRRDLNGNSRLQVLAVIEPFVPENPNIEREYAPVYSFWRSEKNPQTGATSQSLLWNLYRRETAPDHKKVSLLFGLYRHQSDARGTRTRLFYIPLGKSKPDGK